MACSYNVIGQAYSVPRGKPQPMRAPFYEIQEPGGFMLFDSLMMMKEMTDTSMKPLYPALKYLNYPVGGGWWEYSVDSMKWKPIGGGGGGANFGRWGIEDNLGLQNRAIDMQGFNYTMSNNGTLWLYNGDGTYAGLESEFYLTNGQASMYAQTDSSTGSGLSVNNAGTFNANSFNATNSENISIFPTSIRLGSGDGYWQNSDTTNVLTTDINGDLHFVKTAGSMRFGIEDNLGIQNRAIDMQTDSLDISNTSKFSVETSGASSFSVEPSLITVTTPVFKVDGIANTVFPNVLYYDTATKEVTYGSFSDIDTVPSLQAVTDVGHTTTNSIIIGSSTVAHSGVSGQLVQGASSTASAAATDGVSLNHATVTGATATGINTSTASGTNSFSSGVSNTASGTGSAAVGGTGNTVSGAYSLVTGNNNSLTSLESFTAGINNTSSSGTVSDPTYAFGNLVLGVANKSDSLARGSAAIGGVNSVDNDFSLAMGYNNTAKAKGSLAIAFNSLAKTYGEVTMSSSAPIYNGKSAQPTGDVQTEILNYSNYDKVVASNSHTLAVKICTDNSGNEQGCGADYGLTYYEVDDNTVQYIQGRMIGITSGGDVTVWTIDTWFKNIGGTITSGTTAFTAVQKDASFTNMDAATLTFTTTTGNIKRLDIVYHNTSTYPIAMYTAQLIINKLTYSN